MKISTIRKRGNEPGLVLTPHKHKDGTYVASPTRFERDYIRVLSIEALIVHIERGLKIRMSAPGFAPSLIAPASLKIER
jgi:hypothetical protein